MTNTQQPKFLNFRHQEFETICKLLSSVFQTDSQELTQLYKSIENALEEDGWPHHFVPKKFFQSKDSSFRETYEKSPSIAADLPSFLEWEDGNEEKPTIVLLGQDPKGHNDHKEILVGTPYGLHHRGSNKKLTTDGFYFRMISVLMTLGYRVYLTDIFKIWVCNPQKPYDGISLPKVDRQSFIDILEQEIETVKPVAVVTWGRPAEDSAKNLKVGCPILSFPHPGGAANGTWKELMDQSPTHANKLRYFKEKVQLGLQIDKDIDQAIEKRNSEKHYRIFPSDIKYLASAGRAIITFENGASHQFNPLHIQAVMLETAHPTHEQLGDIVIRAGGESLHWPQLEASIGIENLLLGRYGTDKWMQDLKTAA